MEETNHSSNQNDEPTGAFQLPSQEELAALDAAGLAALRERLVRAKEDTRLRLAEKRRIWEAIHAAGK